MMRAIAVVLNGLGPTLAQAIHRGLQRQAVCRAEQGGVQRS
jgi:hypothetical protein